MSTAAVAGQGAPAPVPIEPRRLFIDSEWSDSSSGKTTTSINPATEEPITTVAKGTADDAHRAAAAAKRAFEESGWATLRGSERAKVLQRIADLIEESAHELAYREAIDMGMLYRNAADVVVPHIANMFRYGLASGVQTADFRTALAAAEQIKAGTVWINTWYHYDPSAPFGGYNESGYGRGNGPESLDAYTQVKTVWLELAR
jgi:acyl-CoA reductase-like NAD-dependent aldehyde dehydrogenase